MIFAPYEKTPIEAAADIAEYLEGQTACDVGCGDGEFMLAMSEYADEVFGVEADDSLANAARGRGLEVLCEDFLHADISRANVLFCFMSFYGTSRLAKKLVSDGWRGTVITHYYPLHTNPSEFWKPMKVMDKSCPLLVYEL